MRKREQGVKIDKSGKFDLISAAWEPKKGDMIRLMKRQDGKFIELGRETGLREPFNSRMMKQLHRFREVTSS